MSTASDDIEHSRWTTLRARKEGDFFYSVATTGVYCRPSCGARVARPENVLFHASSADAERLGFRPCKRCKPDQPPLAERQAAQVAEWCRLIERESPTLEELARHAGLSSFHVQRTFKAVTGVTPKAYAAAQRARRVRAALQSTGSVTAAIYEAGYGSSARFYEQSSARLGMNPTRYRAGGKDVAIHFTTTSCSLGTVLVAASEQGVCAILLGSDPAALRDDLARRFPHAVRVASDASFDALVAQVVELIERPRRAPALPLDIRGTAFQELVWLALTKIPAGTTATYTEIARALGRPNAVRAVAGACAANPLAVAIPCHRVVRRDGDLAGYRWGIERKRALLAREAP